jgi:hypothetical protein
VDSSGMSTTHYRELHPDNPQYQWHMERARRISPRLEVGREVEGNERLTC